MHSINQIINIQGRSRRSKEPPKFQENVKNHAKPPIHLHICTFHNFYLIIFLFNYNGMKHFN